MTMQDYIDPARQKAALMRAEALESDAESLRREVDAKLAQAESIRATWQLPERPEDEPYVP